MYQMKQKSHISMTSLCEAVVQSTSVRGTFSLLKYLKFTFTVLHLKKMYLDFLLWNMIKYKVKYPKSDLKLI